MIIHASSSLASSEEQGPPTRRTAELDPPSYRTAGRTWSSKQRAAIVARTSYLLQDLYTFEAEDRPDEGIRRGPSPLRVIEALKALIDVVLPGRFSSGVDSPEELLPFLEERLMHAARVLGSEIHSAIAFRQRAIKHEGNKRPAPQLLTEAALEAFLETIPTIRLKTIEDVEAAYIGDPAASSYAEVKISYPGIVAIISHRFAHELYKLSVPIIPRIIAEWTHSETGIDIHPGAQIGRSFFIDHGTGVVIGETAVIGNHVRIYQGATLGARSFALDQNGQPIKGTKRHPTIEDDVVIYSNAVILGGDTIIGKGSTIGGGALVLESIPPDTMVIPHRPELKLKPARLTTEI